MTDKIGRPQDSEIAPHAKAYVDLVPGDDVLAILSEQIERTLALLSGIGDERASGFRYAPGKWTAKDIAGHLSDTERIFAYRALRIGRQDTTPLPKFEQNDYVEKAGSNERQLQDLVEELRLVRQASLALFRGLPEAAWMRCGRVSEWDLTVRGIAFTTAGHELHHYRILQERYAG